MANNIVNIDIRKGCIIVNTATMVFYCDTVALISVDLTSKYAVINGCIEGGGDGPSILLSKDSDTIQTDDLLEEDSQIEFKDFVGYGVFSATVTKYTLNVCLVKHLSPKE